MPVSSPGANMAYAPNGSTVSYVAPFPTNAWFSDTGATHHVTPDIASLSHSKEYHGPDQLHMGNGKGLPIQHIGNTSINSLSLSTLFTQYTTE